MRSSKGNNKCVYWEHVFECRMDISRNMYRLEKVFWKIFRTCLLDHIMLYRKLSWFSRMFSHGDSYLWLVVLMLFSHHHDMESFIALLVIWKGNASVISGSLIKSLIQNVHIIDVLLNNSPVAGDLRHHDAHVTSRWHIKVLPNWVNMV